MVFKVSKGGVRSGNTLRGLHSRRTKMYGRHACLIGSSSLGQLDLNSFLTKIQSSQKDSLVGDTLKRTNVLLSLNKKQRWRVPALINQMISSGNFDKKKMISLLERHKLKRRANCVRFASNCGRLRSVAPKQKKYFSFSLDKIDEEESKREKRRIRAEESSKQMERKMSLVKKNKGKIKTINVFTTAGRRQVVSNSNKLLESSKEEYRVEVLYPCPQSCSLTFNPKYTDVVLEEGKSGNLEVKSNVKARRNKKKHHRRRFNFKDLDSVCNDILEEDGREMWETCSESECEDNQEKQHATENSKYMPDVNHLEVLINEAGKAQKIFTKRKHKQNKNKVRKQNVVETLDVDNVHIRIVEQNKETVDNSASSRYLQVQDLKPLDSTKVILKSSETTISSLMEKYGALYSEDNCQPRRFMINVTDDVACLLSQKKSSSTNPKFVSYLVFIHDGIYDDGLDVFRVMFNSNCCKNDPDISGRVSFAITTIDDVMNIVIAFLLDLKDEKGLDADKLYVETLNLYKNYHFLYDRMNMKVKSFYPAYAITEQSVSGCEEEELKTVDSHHAFLSVDFDQEIFCDICYDDINPTKLDAVHGTKLLKCGHNCCDDCWAAHFQSRIRNGATTITCPGYNCTSEIGFTTLLSIIHVSDVALLFQRKTEAEVEVSDNAKWCPNPSCGRVIKVDSINKDLCQDVVCGGCGTEICFQCFGSAHWPAKCDQAEDYLDKLSTIEIPEEDEENVEQLEAAQTFPAETLKDKNIKPVVLEVEGRICPKCSKFIDKHGGCNHMMCTCGYNFCWGCCKEPHSKTCTVDKDFLAYHTRKVHIYHKRQYRDQPQSFQEDHRRIDNAKQRSMLYRRALQQRKEVNKLTTERCKPLVLKIVSTARKDLQFKKEIIQSMGLQSAPDNEETLQTFNVKPSIVHLIKSSIEIKKVLHHVTEFSFVLLQDTPHSVEKQRILKLANDLSGICSFIRSILELNEHQNAKSAFQRLVNIQDWAKRAVDALISATRRLRQE